MYAKKPKNAIYIFPFMLFYYFTCSECFSQCRHKLEYSFRYKLAQNEKCKEHFGVFVYIKYIKFRSITAGHFIIA